MTLGATITREARKDLGCRETPPGSNDGPCVRALQASTGAYNAPWCGSAVKAWAVRAGVVDLRGYSASTWMMVEQARAAGLLISEPVEGCSVVWKPGPSGHTEDFIRWVDRARGAALTIGGNTGDAVREHVRDVRGAYFIAPSDLTAPPKPVYRTVYWWECPGCTPTRHGLYARPEYREKAIRLWVERHGNPGHVRRGKLSVLVDGRLQPRWTFWTGPRKRSADFDTKEKRDASMKAYLRTHPSARLRTRSKRVRVS
ncbi:MAG: hypothetical protein AB7G65_19360 [Thermoleophilia bacterium]